MKVWVLRGGFLVLALTLVLVLLSIFPLAKTVRVETQYGILLGKQEEGVKRFLGVPFAKPPLGDLRWKKPQALETFATPVYKAYKKSPACLQGAEPNPALLTGQSEDCLYLNIWVPEGEGPFPVMYWIHGGGFLLGSASEASYDGHFLAKTQQVAVVSANYRLGYLGYLSLPESSGEELEGNQAYYDQLEVLKWIQENGELFKLDTNNVTVFGESAGSMSTCMLLASPLSNELIDKVILQSGACVLKPQRTVAEAEKYGLAFLEKISCDESDDAISCARSKSHEAIYAALDVQPNEMFMKGFQEWSFAPSAVIGTAFLPDTASRLLESSQKENVAMMIGVTENEGSLFDGMNEHPVEPDLWVNYLDSKFPELGEELSVLYPWEGNRKSGEISSQILTDAIMTCPSLSIAKLWSEKHPAYFYLFSQKVTAPVFELMSLDWDENAGELGIAHSTEIPYIMGNNGVLGFVLSDKQKKTRKKMSRAWGNFAKYSDPNGISSENSEPSWKQFTQASPFYAQFRGGEMISLEHLRKQYCDFWQKQNISNAL